MTAPNAEPVCVGVPSGRCWCVTHSVMPIRDTDCCVYAKCDHRPRCDIRRLLIEPAQIDGSGAAS